MVIYRYNNNIFPLKLNSRPGFLRMDILKELANRTGLSECVVCYYPHIFDHPCWFTFYSGDHESVRVNIFPGGQYSWGICLRSLVKDFVAVLNPFKNFSLSLIDTTGENGYLFCRIFWLCRYFSSSSELLGKKFKHRLNICMWLLPQNESITVTGSSLMKPTAVWMLVEILFKI